MLPWSKFTSRSTCRQRAQPRQRSPCASRLHSKRWNVLMQRRCQALAVPVRRTSTSTAAALPPQARNRPRCGSRRWPRHTARGPCLRCGPLGLLPGSSLDTRRGLPFRPHSASGGAQHAASSRRRPADAQMLRQVRRWGAAVRRTMAKTMARTWARMGGSATARSITSTIRRNLREMELPQASKPQA